MLLKEIIDSPCGMRFVFDSLQLSSGYGRKLLLDRSMETDVSRIGEDYDRLRQVYEACISGKEDGLLRRRLENKLRSVRDISGTLDRLAGKSVLEEIELFEIKCLSILSGEVGILLEEAGLRVISLPDTAPVMRLLDPENTKIPAFYIYDIYSEELRRLRNELKRVGGYAPEAEGFGVCGCASFAAADPGRDRIVADADPGPEVYGSGQFTENGTAQEQLRQELIGRIRDLEEEIRKQLCRELRPCEERIRKTLDLLGELDILLAKAVQIKEFGLCFPDIPGSVPTDGTTRYEGMFHPQIRCVLESFGKRYVPVDIGFGLEPVTLIGANMGGKTVVLKTVALCQYLYQFGFGIPAAYARIDCKERILLCVGDRQDELSGLSSFAAEIRGIDEVISAAGRGEKLLALVDEPARTTNPIEGTALVSALLREICELQRENGSVSLLLTTHYNIGGEGFRRLRVIGLVDGEMDYRLVEAKTGDIPHEAISIARKLGVNERWLRRAEALLAGKSSMTIH